MSTLKELLAALDGWRHPDGLQVGEPETYGPATIKFSGKLSLSRNKMDLGRARCEARMRERANAA